MSLRAVKQMIETKPTVEGAGVKLQRAFGFGKTKEFDPFLLLDDFRNENPEDYAAGFPSPAYRANTIAGGPVYSAKIPQAADSTDYTQAATQDPTPMRRTK